MDDGVNPLPSEQETVELSSSAVPDPHPGHWLPARIGAYRILSLLGEGGMGAVYEAEQDKPHRKVALKVIRPGYTSPTSLRRFEQEAQALARLQHPGIAQVYEFGVAQNEIGIQPYFAMELIVGRTLVDYASSAKLDLRRKLQLFILICDAVHHAHQRGIIHRDLKPANILIDTAGQPKILDFGVARVTDADAQATQTSAGQLVGTIAYMSPEQVVADPLEIDTRTDVYALGVVLYELLAGRLPYRTDLTITEALHAICEADASPLGSVDRSFRGDIETIVARALEKDKSRRYSSAAELGADIRRFLSDEPIVARPPSTLYHLHKMARRHKGLVAALAAIFLVLAGGIIASTREAWRATRAEQSALADRDRAVRAEEQRRVERDRATQAERAAEKERDRALEANAIARAERDRSIQQKERADTAASTAIAISDFLRDDLLAQSSVHRQASRSLKPDPDIKVREVLERAAVRIGGKFSAKPTVEAALRNTIGSTYRDLGLYEQAEKQLVRALELESSTPGGATPQSIAISAALGDVYRLRGRNAEAQAMLEKALQNSQRVHGLEATGTLEILTSLGDLYRAMGSYKAAEDVYRQVLAVRRRKDGPGHPLTIAAVHDVGLVAWSQKRYDEAEALLQQAMTARERVLGPEHPATLDSIGSVATLYWERNRFQDAAPLFTKTLEVRRRILGADHPETLVALGNLGALYWRMGGYAQAEKLWTEAVSSSRRVLGPSHMSTLINMNNLAELYRTSKRLRESEELYTAAAEGFRKSAGEEHPRTLTTFKNLALVYQDQKRYEEAGVLLTRVLDARTRALGRKHQDTAIAAGWLGTLRLQQERYADAEKLLRGAVESWAQSAPDDYRRFLAQGRLGASIAAQNRSAEAEQILAPAVTALERQLAQLPAQARPEVQQAVDSLIAVYEQNGKRDKAAEWKARKLEFAKVVQ